MSAVFVAPMPNQVFRDFMLLKDADSCMNLHSASYHHFLICSPACSRVDLNKKHCYGGSYKKKVFLLEVRSSSLKHLQMNFAFPSDFKVEST